jgi:hypothetical protein
MGAFATAKMSRESCDIGSTARADTERVRRAIGMAVRVLAERPDGEDVRQLLGEAERLLAQTQSWHSAPPSPEVRDEVMRSVMSIHVSALRASRGG